MENIKLFLETSTIHGLQYLSTARKLDKVLWTFIVAFGFLSAGLLIYQSFQNWSKNPITTTTTILPINEAKLPKITVCPPKNTYTNLNYDIQMADDVQLLNNKTQKKILKRFLMKMHEFDFLKTYSRLFEGPEQFMNWFKGINVFDKSNIPQYSSSHQTFTTYSNNGTIQTPHFREAFNEENFTIRASYYMKFKPPKEMAHNISLFLQIEYDINKEFEKIELNYKEIELSENPMLVELQLEKFRPYFDLVFKRDFVNEINFLSWKKKKMTGMKISWYYSEEFIPTRNKNENFVSLGTP